MFQTINVNCGSQTQRSQEGQLAVFNPMESDRTVEKQNNTTAKFTTAEPVAVNGSFQSNSTAQASKLELDGN